MKSGCTRCPREAWATGYQQAGMQHSGYKLGEQQEMVEVDEDLHKNSNLPLHPSLCQRQCRGVCTGRAWRRSREHQPRNHTQVNTQTDSELQTELGPNALWGVHCCGRDNPSRGKGALRAQSCSEYFSSTEWKPSFKMLAWIFSWWFQSVWVFCQYSLLA